MSNFGAMDRNDLFEAVLLKASAGVFSLISILATEPILMSIFPSEYFNFRALVYAFVGNSIFGVLEIIRKEKDFNNGIEGIKPFTKREFLFITLRPSAAAIFNFGLNAFIQSLLVIYDIELLRKMAEPEGVIIMGLIVGFSFEFINGKVVASWLSDTLKSLLGVLKKGLISLLSNLLKSKDDG